MGSVTLLTVKVPEVGIEAASVRHVFFLVHTQVPLAYHVALVSGISEVFGHDLFVAARRKTRESVLLATRSSLGNAQIAYARPHISRANRLSWVRRAFRRRYGILRLIHTHEICVKTKTASCVANPDGWLEQKPTLSGTSCSATISHG